MKLDDAYYQYMSKDKDFESLRWVAKAVSKDALRYNLTCILIEDGTATATDGHRLHHAQLLEDIPNGLYELVHNNQKSIMLKPARDYAEYVEWRRCIPSNTSHLWETDTHPLESGDGELHVNSVLNYVLKRHDKCFSVPFLIDACPENCSLTFSQDMKAVKYGSHTALVIRNVEQTKLALIMPLKDAKWETI
jgi:hypothetical protein